MDVVNLTLTCSMASGQHPLPPIQCPCYCDRLYCDKILLETRKRTISAATFSGFPSTTPLPCFVAPPETICCISYRLQENDFGKARGRNPRRRTTSTPHKEFRPITQSKIFFLKSIAKIQISLSIGIHFLPEVTRSVTPGMI